MYSGHNCTNYVAYRMVKSGMRNERPWSGGGNAMYWGTEMRRITDDRPMVGAVAWWKANVPGAGSVGHVAYVERVVSRRKIVVSEDSWGGDFGWKTHHPARAAAGRRASSTSTTARSARPAAPEITGTPAIGDAVTGRPRPLDARRRRSSVQWLAGGKPIAGATDERLHPDPRPAAHSGSRSGSPPPPRGFAPGMVRTAATPRVARGTLRDRRRPDHHGHAPRRRGAGRCGPARSRPSATSRAFRWYADGERIAGADRPRLRLTQEHIRSRSNSGCGCVPG